AGVGAPGHAVSSSSLDSVVSSSRRRQTRFSRDWSSDVCSSDRGIARRERQGMTPETPLNRGNGSHIAKKKTRKGSAGKGEGKERDRKSTRLNSSHVKKSYAVLCLKKKKNTDRTNNQEQIEIHNQ